jgi:UDP-N-acetylglucosamine pyrophosphorylase
MHAATHNAATVTLRRHPRASGTGGVRIIRGSQFHPHEKEGRMRLDVVIMAAGKGTRMKSARPKVLHPLAGRA